MLFLNKPSGISPVKFTHLLNVQVKVLAFLLFSNKFSGILPVRFLQPLKVQSKLVISVQFLNKFSGILPVTPEFSKANLQSKPIA